MIKPFALHLELSIFALLLAATLAFAACGGSDATQELSSGSTPTTTGSTTPARAPRHTDAPASGANPPAAATSVASATTPVVATVPATSVRAQVARPTAAPAVTSTASPVPTATPRQKPTPIPRDESSPESDRIALIALYNSTDGPNWTIDTDTDIWTWLKADHGYHWGSLQMRQGFKWWSLDRQDRVTELDFGGFLGSIGLRGGIAPEIGNLHELESLVLNQNDLSGPIPSELGNLRGLERLDLSRNQLSGEIPPELGSIGQLTNLDLSHNQLSGEITTELAEFLSQWDMSFDLSYNRLSGRISRESPLLESGSDLVKRLDGLVGNDLSIPASITTTVDVIV